MAGAECRCVTGLMGSGRGGEGESERGGDEGAGGRLAEGEERFRAVEGLSGLRWVSIQSLPGCAHTN